VWLPRVRLGQVPIGHVAYHMDHRARFHSFQALVLGPGSRNPLDHLGSTQDADFGRWPFFDFESHWLPAGRLGHSELVALVT